MFVIVTDGQIVPNTGHHSYQVMLARTLEESHFTPCHVAHMKRKSFYITHTKDHVYKHNIKYRTIANLNMTMYKHQSSFTSSRG